MEATRLLLGCYGTVEPTWTLSSRLLMDAISAMNCLETWRRLGAEAVGSMRCGRCRISTGTRTLIYLLVTFVS